MSEYKVFENQNLLDISAHVYGRVDVTMDLAILNNISITEVLQPGTIIQLVDAPIDAMVKKALESRGIIPATTTGIESSELDGTSGIGSMIIGINFIVG